MVVEQDERDVAGLTKLPDLAALSQDKPPAAAMLRHYPAGDEAGGGMRREVPLKRIAPAKIFNQLR